MGIDQFPSPFKIKPLIKKQKSETPVQSEIQTPSKSKEIENSRTITSIEHDNRSEDLLSWIDDLDSRMKRTLSRQYLESVELKNQTTKEDLREKYRQVPFDDSFRKLRSILKNESEVTLDNKGSYGDSQGIVPTYNEDGEIDSPEDMETKEDRELGSSEESEDDIIEIISSDEGEISDSGNVSNICEENEEDEEETPEFNMNPSRTQGVIYHIKNGRPRLSDTYMNINNNEQDEKSECSSGYSNENDDGIDIDEMNEVEGQDEDEHEDENEDEDQYEEEHEEEHDQGDSNDEIIILDSDEEDSTVFNKEKGFESGSNPASVTYDEDSENEAQYNLNGEIDDDDIQEEDEDEEHQEYVYPNNNLEHNSSISSVYSNHAEPMNTNKVIDGRNIFQSDNLMGLAEAVLKESNEMTDENSFMTAHDSDTLYSDAKSGIPQYSTNINSGYIADYDSTDVNYQAGNLSGIEEENKVITDLVSHKHESFFKEASGSNDAIQLVDDFENVSEGSLADEERDYEASSNNDKENTSKKYDIFEKSDSNEMEENSQDSYSIEVEHVNDVPIFKTVAEEDPETVLFKLKEAEEKFNIRLNSIKYLEDEIILKNGHLPEAYIPNQYIEKDKNDISKNEIYGKEKVVDSVSIPRPIPKPLLQDLSVLDETTFFETTIDGDDNEEAIHLPALKQLDDGKPLIGEMDDNDSQNVFKAENVSGPISGQVGLEKSVDIAVDNKKDGKHEPVLETSDYDLSETKDSTNNVNYEMRENNTDSDDTDHVGGTCLDQIYGNESQMNDIISNEMKEEMEHIDVPALERVDVDQSKSYTTINEMEIDSTKTRSNDILDQGESSRSNSNYKILFDAVEENQGSIRVPALEQVEADQSRIDDTTMNDTVEKDQESINAPALEADQSRNDDTTMNETAEENQESIRVPALEQVEADQSRIDDTTMNETAEENQESIRVPALEQVEADQSRIDDTTMNETAEENQESIRVPALEQVEADQSGIDDTTMNETAEENQESIRVPALEQVEADASIVDTYHEMADEDEGHANSLKGEVIKQGEISLMTDEIYEVEDKFSQAVTGNIPKKSISEMTYPSITQELDDMHEENYESKISNESTDLDNEILNKTIDSKYESYIELEKNTSDRLPINKNGNDIDLNKDIVFDTSVEYENKQNLSSDQIVEEPQEAEENIVFEYEQTTYVNVMGDGILHPSYIMEPIEEQEETHLPDHSEQLEIISGTSAIDNMEVLEPSAIIEPNDTETDRVELINSAFEQQYEVIEPTDVLEPPSRSQTPKLIGTHRESIDAENFVEKEFNEESRKRRRESEGFVRSKLRKLIYKPFQWFSKNRKSSPIIPSHIEAPKLRPLDDNTSISSSNQNSLKPLKEDADIKANRSTNNNNKKYYELMRHLKKSVDLKSNEIEKGKLDNILDHEKEENNSDDHMVDNKDEADNSTMDENELDINASTKAEEKTFEDEKSEQSLDESHLNNNRSDVTSNSDDNLPYSQLEIIDSIKHSKSPKQRRTSSKYRRPKKVLGLDMSEAHIEPVRSLRSGHKYGPEENDDVQNTDLFSSPKKVSRSNKELPKLRINKRRNLSNMNALDNSSPIEIDSKQSSPSSRKSSGSKWIEPSLLDHPALRTRSKSPLKRSIYEISSDLEEDSNLPRRSRRLRRHNEKLNDDAAHKNENTDAEEEVKRGRPTKRH